MSEILNGRFKLVERINAGGMAEVYKAHLMGFSGFHRLVAIKRLLPRLAADPRHVEMFITEAKMTVHLNHPNIAQVYELGRDGDSFYIVMEYIHGRDLKAIWKRQAELGEPTPIPLTLHLIRHVTEALHHAHFARDQEGMALDLIHRDVTPQNMLVSYGGQVKMIDFGVAKAKGRAIQTRDGIVKGKLAYLSPEQAHGEELDRRSDIFAVGICTWELLTGKRAFWRKSTKETIHAVRTGLVAPPQHYNPEIDDPLNEIVMKALAVDPEERYRTALELQLDLEQYIAESGHHCLRREVQGYMRRTFPEGVASYEMTSEAISLVRAKPARHVSMGDTQNTPVPAEAPPELPVFPELLVLDDPIENPHLHESDSHDLGFEDELEDIFSRLAAVDDPFE